MTDPIRHGLVGSHAANRRQMSKDQSEFREQQERAENEWKKERQMKTKKMPFGGVVNRPDTTDKAQSNVNALGGLLNDLADAIKTAQAREQVVDGASDVDRGRFPTAGSAR